MSDREEKKPRLEKMVDASEKILSVKNLALTRIQTESLWILRYVQQLKKPLIT